MNQVFFEMTEAIDSRRSCRQFQQIRLNLEHEQQILDFMSHVHVPFEHDVSIEYHSTPDDKNVVYFKGPKQFLALSTTETPIEQAKLGFLGEQIILYSESIGVRTCWMGHYSTKEVHEIVYGKERPNPDRPLYCIILLGYIPEKTGLLDRFSQKRMSKKNKTVESFLHKESITEFPDYIRYSLELASRAPSAMNSQKWYYLVEMNSDRYSIELSKPRGYQHFKWRQYDIDVGTAAAHMWLGLKSRGKEPEVIIHDRDGDAIWRFELESD
jgi:hypothetical protein